MEAVQPQLDLPEWCRDLAQISQTWMWFSILLLKLFQLAKKAGLKSGLHLSYVWTAQSGNLHQTFNPFCSRTMFQFCPESWWTSCWAPTPFAGRDSFQVQVNSTVAQMLCKERLGCDMLYWKDKLWENDLVKVPRCCSSTLRVYSTQHQFDTLWGRLWSSREGILVLICFSVWCSMKIKHVA